MQRLSDLLLQMIYLRLKSMQSWALQKGDTPDQISVFVFWLIFHIHRTGVRAYLYDVCKHLQETSIVGLT